MVDATIAMIKVQDTKRNLHQKLKFGDGENQCKFGSSNVERLYPFQLVYGLHPLMPTEYLLLTTNFQTSKGF
jgi:hypothetical protein